MFKISERIDWLMKLRKKGGFSGFWNIRKESAEWGYTLALADIEQLFIDLTDEEKSNPVVQKLYNKIREIQ